MIYLSLFRVTVRMTYSCLCVTCGAFARRVLNLSLSSYLSTANGVCARAGQCADGPRGASSRGPLALTFCLIFPPVRALAAAAHFERALSTRALSTRALSTRAN